MPAFLIQLITKFLTSTDGYKTFFSGIGLVGYALYLAFSSSPPNYEEAIKQFLYGLSILGIGHKIAKNTAAQNVVDGPITPETLVKETPLIEGDVA